MNKEIFVFENTLFFSKALSQKHFKLRIREWKIQLNSSREKQMKIEKDCGSRKHDVTNEE